MSMYEWIDRQPYYAEIIDQGLSKTKTGKVNIKFYLRVLGKVKNPFDVENSLEEIPGYHEIEMVFWLDGTEDQLNFRLKDLQRMGLEGDDLTVVDPRHEKHQSFKGHKLMVAPKIQETDNGNRIYWNPLAEPKQKKRFIGDVSLDEAKQSLSSLSERIRNLNKPKEEVLEAAPF